MWDRILFAVRGGTVDIGARLGSWRLSIVLMVVAALYYTFLTIWAGSSPPHVVQNIAFLTPFWIVYALLLLNSGVCLWNRFPLLRRNLSREPRWNDLRPDWVVETDGELGPAQARALVRRLRYRVTTEDAGRVAAVRLRWTALGSYMFHGAFFLLAVGFLLTLVSRQEATVWVAVGESFESRPDQFRSMTAPRILGSNVTAPRFAVDRILPEFWHDELLFTRLEAELRFPDGSTTTTRINRPLWIGPATFLRLSGLGYTPRYQLSDGQGEVLDTAFVKLNVFPPGQRDYFTLPDYPHRFYLEVLPDIALEDGTPVTNSLNLIKPGVVLRVFRGRLDLGGTTLTEDQAFAFEGLQLSFPEIRYWGEFSIVRDPGAPVIFLAYVVGLAGLLLKLPGRRREVEWSAGVDGRSGIVRGWGGRPPRGMTRVEPDA